jgi:tetratricopeptide (TPR) repeat protein
MSEQTPTGAGDLALYKDQERLCRQSGDLNGLQASLGKQAGILYGRGDLDGALTLWKEREGICRQLGNLDGLSRSLGNQANILYERGDLDRALALYTEAERICRQLGNLESLSKLLGGQAVILKARGDLDGAMALHKEEERICRQLENRDGLKRSLGNQANILSDRGDLDGAMALYKEAERIFRQLGNLDDLSAALGNQALLLRDRGDLDGALTLWKEQERICRHSGNLDGLSISLSNQASILSDLGDLEGAALGKGEGVVLGFQPPNRAYVEASVAFLRGMAEFMNDHPLHYERELVFDLVRLTDKLEMVLLRQGEPGELLLSGTEGISWARARLESGEPHAPRGLWELPDSFDERDRHSGLDFGFLMTVSTQQMSHLAGGGGMPFSGEIVRLVAINPRAQRMSKQDVLGLAKLEFFARSLGGLAPPSSPNMAQISAYNRTWLLPHFQLECRELDQRGTGYCLVMNTDPVAYFWDDYKGLHLQVEKLAQNDPRYLSLATYVADKMESVTEWTQPGGPASLPEMLEFVDFLLVDHPWLASQSAIRWKQAVL